MSLEKSYLLFKNLVPRIIWDYTDDLYYIAFIGFLLPCRINCIRHLVSNNGHCGMNALKAYPDSSSAASFYFYFHFINFLLAAYL